MKALILKGPLQASLEDLPRPSPPPGWALVKSAAVGVCGTDKAFYRGTYPLFKKPLVPGHEVSGVVVEGPEELVGSRVVSEINFACRGCSVCQAGMYTHCPRRRTLGIDFDGGMAEYFIAPVWALHPHGLSHEKAFAAEPLAAVLNALRTRPPRPGWLVAVLGSGFIAALAAQVLRYMGFNTLVVGREGSSKLERLAGMGFRVATLGEAVEIGVSESWSGLGFDMVFEATGSNEGLKQAISLARPRGVIHVKSTPGGVAEYPQTAAVVKEVELVGTRCGSSIDFRTALKLLVEGRVSPIVDAELPLEQGPEALEKAMERGVFRVLIKP